MGRLISFYKNDYEKDLKEIIFENFDGFKKWYLDYEMSSLKDYNEQFGNEELKNYLRKDADFRYDFIYLEQQLIDELTSEFIAEYFDGTFRDNNFLDFFGPTMSKWRYEESTKMVEETDDTEFLKLWNYLIKGRSLKDNNSFCGYSNELKIGYLSQHEIRLLKEKIELHFATLDFIKEKYWTDGEKQQWEEATSPAGSGFYSLSNHNPKSSGLEYVLETISYLTSDNVVLISEIE